MQLIRGLNGLGERQRGCVVTIGTFDGIHLGHQALLGCVAAHARRLGRPSMVLTFEPMPREYLAGDDCPARLTTFRERWQLFATFGVEVLWVLRFDASLRSLSGEGFARLLAEPLRAPVVVVGHDFRFGRHGEANAEQLCAAGHRLGFQTEVLPPVMLEGERVSSSAVRAALAAGQFGRATRLLGRPYTIRGRVIGGERLGRRLGFPTANLALQRRRSPLEGIFAVRVHGIGAAARPAVASLGRRPTVDGKTLLLEVHLFDFSADLYGRQLEVEFVAKLRDEAHFETLEALVAQMHRDAEAARTILEV